MRAGAWMEQGDVIAPRLNRHLMFVIDDKGNLGRFGVTFADHSGRC